MDENEKGFRNLEKLCMGKTDKEEKKGKGMETMDSVCVSVFLSSAAL